MTALVDTSHTPPLAGGAVVRAIDGAPTTSATVPSGKALVLNASMEPLCVVPARRALVLVLTEKAELLHEGRGQYHSERLAVPTPSVVQLRRYVRVPYRHRATLTRRGVFIRDAHACQYCGRPAENIDHVQPRSRHGEHEWENVVASCLACNSRKGDRTLKEAGMTLTRRPFAPKAAFWMVVAVGRVKPEWEVYLGDTLDAA